MLKFGLDFNLFEVMLRTTAYCERIGNKEACLNKFYKCQGIFNDRNPFDCFVDSSFQLGDFDPSEHFASKIDDPFRSSLGLSFTPYSRGHDHTCVVTGIYQTSGIGSTPLAPIG